MSNFKKLCSEFCLTPTELTNGLMTLSVKALTTAVNAAPITTATARSTMLPRERNSLKPLNIGYPFLDPSARCSVQGEGDRLTQRRACHRVCHAGRQRD